MNYSFLGLLTFGLIAVPQPAFSQAVFDWDGVIYPALADDDDYDTYAAAPYVNDTNFECPPGDFSAHVSFPDNFCTDSSGGHISSWAILNVGQSLCYFSVLACNENDGCSGSGCGLNSYVRIYTTEGEPDENTEWDYHGYLTVPYDSCEWTNSIWTNSPSEFYVLVARSAAGNHAPDPRIQEIDVLPIQGCI